MTPPSWPKDILTRWSRRALRIVALFVPPRMRGDWMAEWEAELWQLRSSGRGLWDVALFIVGAAWHGAWEWKEGWKMDSFAQDVRFAFRTLARSPGFASAAVLMLALAIGANTALFSVLEVAVLSDPPFPEHERLVVVDMLFGQGEDALQDFQSSQWSYPRYQALGHEVQSIENLAGYASRTMTLTELGDPAIVPVEVATPSLFPLLGLTTVRGRPFGPDEEDDGSAKMFALVSHSFWLTRMGGAANPVGSAIILDQLQFQVVGVLAEGFEGVTGGAEVWIPMSALREVENPTLLEDSWNQHFYVMGRLGPDVSLESARSEVQAYGATVMERFPPPVGAERLSAGADVIPFALARLNPAANASMFALSGAVALILLIATANLAGLLLARGASRHREAAIRASLGAGRTRLVRQLLTESVALALVGGSFGVVIAWMGVDTVGVWLADALGTQGGSGLQYLDTNALSVNWRVLSFTTLLTGGVGIALGMLPALQAVRTDPNEWLKGGRGSDGGRGRLRGMTGRNGLIAGQIAIALVLLTGASLMVRSMISLQRVDMGYDADGLLTAMYSLTPADEQAGTDPSTFHLDFLDRLRALPGVSGATLGEVPMGGPTTRTIVLGSEGRPELTPAMHSWIRIQPTADNHFGVLGARLIAGRDIERTDDWNTEKVIVLSQFAAEQFFPNGSPLGQRIQLGWSGYGGTGATVVGVVEGLQLDGADLPREPQGFVPLSQAPRLATGVMIRSTGDPKALIPAVRSTLADLAPTLALTSVMTMADRTASTTARPRVVTMLLSLFGLVSLFLVAAGLYGSIAFSVAQRTKELGLRASLGADRTSLGTLVLRQGLLVTVVGIAGGIVGAVWATRFLQGMLFGIGSLDVGSFSFVIAILIIVASLAAYLPARRAMGVSPMVALRAE